MQGANKQAFEDRRRCLFGSYACSLEYEPSSSAQNFRFSITPMNKRTLMLCSSTDKDTRLAGWNGFPANLPVISWSTVHRSSSRRRKHFRMTVFLLLRGHPPAEGTSAAVSAMKQAWTEATNPESWQPPLYYATAGLWLKVGQLCGFSDGHPALLVTLSKRSLLRSARLAEFSGSAKVLSPPRMGSLVRSTFTGVHPAGHVLWDRER